MSCKRYWLGNLAGSNYPGLFAFASESAWLENQRKLRELESGTSETDIRQWADKLADDSVRAGELEYGKSIKKKKGT